MTSYFDAMRRYFDFSGRSTRSQFWFFTLTLLMIALAAIVIDAVLAITPPDQFGPVFTLVYLAHLIPASAITVRRLHYTGRSGWWVLLGLIPLMGQIVMLVWLCGASQAGGDRFGASTSQVEPNLTQRGQLEPQSGFDKVDVGRIEQLAALRQSGAIDEQEYQALKAKVLSPVQGAAK